MMIETAESLTDVEKIIALNTVDGLFPGPSDLALAHGRGAYAFNDADRAERVLAQEESASLLVVATQTMTLRQGIMTTINALRQEAIVA
ncbi:MAG: hypothetical protein ACRECW_11005 [Phyllobacterium sp.]